MRRADLITFAAGAIIAHPTRSALTSLGVVIGVAAVVMMTSIGLGAQQRVTSAIGGLGSNLLIVSPGASRGPGGGFVSQGAGSGMSLNDDDAEAIGKLDGVAASAPSVRGGAQITLGLFVVDPCHLGSSFSWARNFSRAWFRREWIVPGGMFNIAAISAIGRS
mgnify:CR=1 FL=1